MYGHIYISNVTIEWLEVLWSFCNRNLSISDCNVKTHRFPYVHFLTCSYLGGRGSEHCLRGWLSRIINLHCSSQFQQADSGTVL